MLREACIVAAIATRSARDACKQFDTEIVAMWCVLIFVTGSLGSRVLVIPGVSRTAGVMGRRRVQTCC
jgi:hypothetical protein